MQNERPRPPSRPDLVDSRWVHYKVTAYEDDRWLVRDRYSYGHPVDRSVIDKSVYRYHPNYETIERHPDEKQPSAWALAWLIPWCLLWILIYNM